MLNISYINYSLNCLLCKSDESWLWHRCIAHLKKLVSMNFVVGLPKLKFEKDRVCEVCQKEKQSKISFKHNKFVSISGRVELLHMDLFRPSRIMNLGGSYYSLVVVDDFSRYTWTLFIVTKDDTFKAFKRHAKFLQNEKSSNIVAIKIDH